ncbi:Uncharacterised protein [Mycoplasmopsis bovigenitalium]|uniref:Lipoprotein-associated type-17 domain-containing protein n=1 Tax=Mycoplasmopsis bovigenitalium TaxID=2112 RepID=A0A449A8P7_9BACT|nr:lipoprotein 17-related variable surface protein [Mycoplasmopsis bovigenitalium]VEU60560.1 Uncharacterised protein [Mycoplasmopsis bovigenitalium]
MKKKIGFLLSSCMSVSALPLFAAACKNEQANGGKQEEIDVNTLFKISLPKNTEKKPSELKPEDIVVEILNNDINVEIQKVEFKEGKGVLVSYLATNSKTNKIVDEKTITLEVTTKKDQVETKEDKKYANLITISVDENTKQKTADKVTKEDIKLEVAQGENFKAEVIGVNVQKNNRTVIDVKIKITDNQTSKEITKTLEGFVQALPEKILKGYEVFKDIAIVNDDKAYDWLKNATDGTKIYYDFRKQKFFTGLKEKDKPENPEIFAILETKEAPDWGIETSTPDARQDDNSFKGTALLVKQDTKIGIKFRISQWNNKIKKATYFDEVATSNLITIDRITQNDLNKIASEVVFDYPDKESVLVNNVEQSKITNNIKENYTIEISAIQKVLEQNKLVVNYKVKYSKDGREVESDIQTKEILGFKVDDFSSMFVGLEFTVESKETKLPSEVKNEEIKAVDSDLKEFKFADNITKEVKIKENSADDYRGLLTVVFKATRNSDNSVFEKEYNIDGLKTKNINLDEVIQNFGDLKIKNEINKSETYASAISKSDFIFGDYDKDLVSILISSMKVSESDSTKLIVTLQFSDKTKESNTKTKEYEITGFKKIDTPTNRNIHLNALAMQGTLFAFEDTSKNREEILAYLKNTNNKLKKMLKIDHSFVKGIDKEFYKGKNVKFITLNESLEDKKVVVNTNGTSSKRNIGYNSEKNLGIKIELEDNKVVLKFRLDTKKTEKGDTVIDENGQVFTQVLFTIQ